VHRGPSFDHARGPAPRRAIGIVDIVGVIGDLRCNCWGEVLFERQTELSANNFEKWAAELGLDRDKFAQCLESKRSEAAIGESIEIGRKAGVSVAPRIFFNGVPLTGAESAEALQEIIDDERAQKS